MERSARDEEREERIHNEVIVDAYGPEEQAMGWYYYLEEKLRFPFRARCVAERAISPLRTGDEVEVVRMAPEEEMRARNVRPDSLGARGPGGPPFAVGRGCCGRGDP